MDQVRDQPIQGLVRNEMEKATKMGKLQTGSSNGSVKEVKRKWVPIKDINGPMLANSLQRLVKTPSSGAIKESEESPKNMGLKKVTNRDGLGKENVDLKASVKNSVKGKKALARARAGQSSASGTARIDEEKTQPTTQGRDELPELRDSSVSLLMFVPWLETGYQFRGGEQRDSKKQPCDGASKAEPNCGLGDRKSVV